MIKIIIFIFAFACSTVTHANIFERNNEEVEIRQPLEDKEESLSMMSCQVRDNFDAYFKHLDETVFSRITSELEVLLRPAVDLSGERIQIADEIDSTDLFHVRVLIPVVNLKAHPVSFAGYTRPDIYFLQYNSFERRSELIKKWIKELLEIDDEDLQTWLRDVVEHQNIKEKTLSSESDTWSYEEQLSSPLIGPLGTMLKDKFAKLWFDNTLGVTLKPSENYKDWLLKRFAERLDIIDPKTSRYEGIITNSRSVSSFGSYYYIIDDKEPNEVMTIVSIYFENRSDMPESFERLVSQGSSDEDKNYVTSDDQGFDKLIKTFRSSKEPYNVMKYAHRTDSSSVHHKAIAWNDEYVFSVYLPPKCNKAVVEEEEEAEEEAEEETEETEPVVEDDEDEAEEETEETEPVVDVEDEADEDEDEADDEDVEVESENEDGTQEESVVEGDGDDGEDESEPVVEDEEDASVVEDNEEGDESADEEETESVVENDAEGEVDGPDVEEDGYDHEYDDVVEENNETNAPDLDDP